MSTTSREQSNGRRAEVLAAARALFFAKGYRGTTIEQIARRAGYSKRTVYLDFLNKDELFMSVCAEGAEMLLANLERVPVEELSVEAVLDRYLEVYIRFSREHHQYFRMIFGEASPEIIANCSDVVQLRLAALERACLNVIVELTERAIREGHIAPVDPWETAGIFVGTATGIVLLSMGGSQTVFSQESLGSLVNKALTTFWLGLQRLNATPDGAGDGVEPC
jgi:AcrR family transcriptional regulator